MRLWRQLKLAPSSGAPLASDFRPPLLPLHLLLPSHLSSLGSIQIEFVVSAWLAGWPAGDARATFWAKQSPNSTVVGKCKK